MPLRRIIQNQGFLAACSVVMGAAVGFLTNVVSGHPSWGAGTGTAMLVAVWAALEWRRAESRRSSGRPRLAVQQRVRRLGRGAHLVGVRRPPVSDDVEVDQRVGKTATDTEIIGYDGDAGL